MAILLHKNSILKAWKWKLLKKGFKVQVFENPPIIFCVNYKLKFVNSTCLAYKCVSRHVVFLYKVTNYWPGMRNTALLVIFADPCERRLFKQHCCLYTKLFKIKEITYPFLVQSLTCTLLYMNKFTKGLSQYQHLRCLLLRTCLQVRVEIFITQT